MIMNFRQAFLYVATIYTLDNKYQYSVVIFNINIYIFINHKTNNVNMKTADFSKFDDSA